MTRKIILAILIIILFTFALTAFLRFYKADVNYKKSQVLLKSSSYISALKRVNTAISQNPMIPRYYRGRAQVLLASLAQPDTEKVPEIKKQVLQDLEQAYNLNSQNLVTARNIVPLYYFLAARDITAPGSTENVDPEYLGVTRDFYALLREKYPNDVGVIVLLAKYEQRLGLEEDLKTDVARTEELRPDLLKWYFIP